MRSATFLTFLPIKKRNEILQISQPLKKENGHWAPGREAPGREAPGREFGVACA